MNSGNNLALIISSLSVFPHGICLQWRWPLVLALVAGNLGIALAYILIPVVLIRCIRSMPGAWRPSASLIRFFALFIVSCAATHLMAILVIWYPWYGVEAAVGLCGLQASRFMQLLCCRPCRR